MGLSPDYRDRYPHESPLETPFGSMEGCYQMVTQGGDPFEAEIARFELREPSAIH